MKGRRAEAERDEELGNPMLRTLARGYLVTMALAVGGWFALGGPVWAWVLFVWLVGAPVTLLLSRTTGTETVTELASRFGQLVWRLVSWPATSGVFARKATIPVRNR